jgi:hypothetical protein
MTRYILQAPDRQYFADVHGPDNREWCDRPTDARTWADIDSCIAAARTWKLIHGVELTVLQMASGPNFHSVTMPGTPQLQVVIHG